LLVIKVCDITLFLPGTAENFHCWPWHYGAVQSEARTNSWILASTTELLAETLRYTSGDCRCN